MATSEFNCSTGQRGLTSIYKTFHPKEADYPFFSAAHELSNNRAHSRPQIKSQEIQKNQQPFILLDHSALKL